MDPSFPSPSLENRYSPHFFSNESLDISNLYVDVNFLNQIELNSQHNDLIQNILKSCLIHLRKNRFEEMDAFLKSTLNKLLPKIREIQNIEPKVLKRADKIDLLINPPRPINICSLIQKRHLMSQITLDDFKQIRVIQNLKDDHCEEISLDNGRDSEDHEVITDLDVTNSYAVSISSENVLSFWNLEEEKSEGTLQLKSHDGYGKLKIVGDHVLLKDIHYEPLGEIKSVNIKTREVKELFKLETDEVHIIGNRIFCLLLNGNIEERDQEGKIVQVIDFNRPSEIDLPTVKVSEDFIVVYDECTVYIHDRHEINDEKRNKKFNLQQLTNTKVPVLHIDKNHLYCGLDATTSSDLPDLCIIDLKTATLLHKDKLVVDMDAPEEKYDLSAIMTNKGKAYLAYSTGKLASFDLKKKKLKSFGDYPDVYEFKIDGQVLYAISRKRLDEDFQINAWDLESKTFITSIRIPAYHKMFFGQGKIQVANDEYLYQNDFFTALRDNESNI